MTIASKAFSSKMRQEGGERENFSAAQLIRESGMSRAFSCILGQSCRYPEGGQYITKMDFESNPENVCANVLSEASGVDFEITSFVKEPMALENTSEPIYLFNKWNMT